MKRAFGMPRGFFSPSWMISGGAFDVDIVSLVVDKCNGNGKMPDLISALLRFPNQQIRASFSTILLQLLSTKYQT